MQPFDERIHEEGKLENEALIAFLRRAYRRPVDVVTEEREQTLARIRERLLRYEDIEIPETQASPLYLVNRKANDVGSSNNRSHFSSERSGKNSIWSARIRMLMAVAVVILLAGSMAVLFQSIRQSKSGSGGTNMLVLAEFEGTGSKTFSDLNLRLPAGDVGADFSCDGPGNGSVVGYSKYPYLNDRHPRVIDFNFGECTPLKSTSGGGTLILQEVQVTVDPTTSWKLKIVSIPLSPAPDLHLPALSLPKSQESIGEFAGKGGTILVPGAYSSPISFYPDQPWQLHLVCRGPGKVNVDLDLRDTYQLSSKYKDRLPPQLTYTVPCGASAPVSVSQLFPPLNNASGTVVVDVVADSNVNWHWVVGMCMDSNQSGCQSPLAKP